MSDDLLEPLTLGNGDHNVFVPLNSKFRFPVGNPTFPKTPLPGVDPAAWSKLKNFWRKSHVINAFVLASTLYVVMVVIVTRMLNVILRHSATRLQYFVALATWVSLAGILAMAMYVCLIRMIFRRTAAAFVEVEQERFEACGYTLQLKEQYIALGIPRLMLELIHTHPIPGTMIPESSLTLDTTVSIPLSYLNLTEEIRTKNDDQQLQLLLSGVVFPHLEPVCLQMIRFVIFALFGCSLIFQVLGAFWFWISVEILSFHPRSLVAHLPEILLLAVYYRLFTWIPQR